MTFENSPNDRNVLSYMYSKYTTSISNPRPERSSHQVWCMARNSIIDNISIIAWINSMVPCFMLVCSYALLVRTETEETDCQLVIISAISGAIVWSLDPIWHM